LHTQPIDNRIRILDFLRGFSLFGILAVNIPYLSEPFYGHSSFHSTLSEVIRWLLAFFFTGKFYILFSFLFGYSFSLFWISNNKKGKNTESLFHRRLIGLFLLGLFHGLFLYEGDILLTYSILGFFLIRFKDNSELVWKKIILFFWIVSFFCYGGLGLWSYLSEESGKNLIHSLTQESINNHLSDFWTTTYHKFDELFYSFPYLILYNWPSAFMMFLVGLWGAKNEILNYPQRIVKFSEGKLKWIFTIAILSNALYATSQFYSDQFLLGVIGSAFLAFGGISLCYLYVIGWIYLFFQNSSNSDSAKPNYESANTIKIEYFSRLNKKFINLVSNAGSMSLTNYILQSLICNGIFNGWGLAYYGSLPPEKVFLLIFPIYGINLLFSWIWKKYFKTGPLEFLLRKWIYQ
jgi:uncharacterized protein